MMKKVQSNRMLHGIKYYSALVLPLTSVFLSFPAKAQELSYKNCLELGLEQNYSLRIVKNDEQIAQNNLRYGKMFVLPDLDARGTLTNSIIDSRQKRFSGEIQERSNAKSNSLNSNIALNWTIFDGFGMFVQYRQLNELLEMGLWTTRLTIEDLMASIGTEYYNYLQQRKRLTTLEYVMTLSKERLRITEEKYRIGNQSKFDYQQAKVEYHTDSSFYLQQIQSQEASRFRLNRVLALDPDTSLTIEDTIVIDYNLAYDDIYQQTLSNNISLQIARQKQTLSELDLKLITSRAYPVISLTGGYTFTQSEAQAGILLENRQIGWNYGASITVPILNKFDLHRQRKNAKLEIENARLSLEDLEQDIRSDMNEIYTAYQNNIKLVELEKQNLSIAHDNFDIAMERFRLGDLSGIEMREIERMYLDAEDRLLMAQYQAKLAEISLKQISGRMQEYL
jgi:adhesin transport system outer membrane protein